MFQPLKQRTRSKAPFLGCRGDAPHSFTEGSNSKALPRFKEFPKLFARSCSSEIPGFPATRKHQHPSTPPLLPQPTRPNLIYSLFAPNWRTQGSEASERFCYLALLAAMDQPKSQPRRSSSSAGVALRLTPTADSQSRCGERGALASKSALRQQNARVLAQKQKQSHHKPEGDISTGIAFPTRVQISLLVTGNWTRTI